MTTGKGIHADPLSEFVMMAVLNHVKKHAFLQSEQINHRWQRYCGESLIGKTVAIVGAGEVDYCVAQRCKGFGMRVAVMSRSLTEEEGASRGYDGVFRHQDMRDVMAESDVVVLCVPHTPETERMIDGAVFDAIKPGCLLVIIARGQVVDEDAMINSLESGRLGFAALDVAAIEPLPAQNPLWDFPNVLISPHSASTVSRENHLIADLFIHNMNCMLNGALNLMKNCFSTALGY